MSADELSELQEQAEHGKHAGMAPVSLTMAVLAVLVAVVSLLGHRSHTEEVVLQAKSSDQWAYYQAKNIRRHEDHATAGLPTLHPQIQIIVDNRLRPQACASARDTSRWTRRRRRSPEYPAHR